MKKGFTLAEVLITLAIIGVVAALTIPTLITNYQKHQYVTQLKKTYGTINNAFRNAMARDGFTKLSDTKMIQSIPNPWSSANAEFDAEIKKVLNIQKSYLPGAQMDGDFVTYALLKMPYMNTSSVGSGTASMYTAFLADGSIVYMYATGSLPWQAVLIDVNGLKGPNRYGRDYFAFYLGKDGVLYPRGAQSYSPSSGLSSYSNWQTGNGCGNAPKQSYNDMSNSQGLECSARIMEEGWQMTY